VAEDAQVHGSGVQVDSAVVAMLPGVESHWVPSCEWVDSQLPAYPTSDRRRGGP
jgi:hypothetical protein